MCRRRGKESSGNLWADPWDGTATAANQSGTLALGIKTQQAEMNRCDRQLIHLPDGQTLLVLLIKESFEFASEGLLCLGSWVRTVGKSKGSSPVRVRVVGQNVVAAHNQLLVDPREELV
uniref:Uncharacterized protein n=1 Tax=Micrurus spixii TaxID=129469 RepID=A0A2D4N1P9_9SAUR